MGVSQLPDLPGRPAFELHCRADSRGIFLGQHSRTGFAAGVSWLLAADWTDFSGYFAACGKIFAIFPKNYEKTICILEKIGYNRG